MEAMVMQVQLGTTPWRISSMKDAVVARRSGSAHCLAARRAIGSSKINGSQVSLLTWSPLYGVSLLKVSLCWMINVCVRWNCIGIIIAFLLQKPKVKLFGGLGVWEIGIGHMKWEIGGEFWLYSSLALPDSSLGQFWSLPMWDDDKLAIMLPL